MVTSLVVCNNQTLQCICDCLLQVVAVPGGLSAMADHVTRLNELQLVVTCTSLLVLFINIYVLLLLLLPATGCGRDWRPVSHG